MEQSQSPVGSMSKEQLMDRIFKDVSDWFESTAEPFHMQWVSQRYNRAAKRLGYYAVSDLLAEDSRLVVKTNRKGSRLIAPREALESFVADGTFKTTLDFWYAFKCPLA